MEIVDSMELECSARKLMSYGVHYNGPNDRKTYGRRYHLSAQRSIWCARPKSLNKLTRERIIPFYPVARKELPGPLLSVDG